MRASATSRISSAHLAAAQTKPDANKADGASPFALLVQEAAPKDAAKTAHKDSHSPDDQKDADKPSVKKDDQTGAQAQAKPVQTAAPANTEKSGKTDEKPVDAKDAAQDVEAAANQDQPAPPQPVNPQIQQAIQPGIVPAAATNDTGTQEIAAAGEIQDTKAAQQPAQNNAPAAPATSPEEQPQDAQTAAGNAPVDKTAAAKPAKSTAKTEGVKAESVKAAKVNNAADNAPAAKTADAKADAQTDAQADAKTDAANAALTGKTAAAHDAGPAADTNHIAANSLAAPQTQQTTQTPTATLTQHVQVGAQGAPNVPALAVQIAAKSLGGAKQFDIRLDPPELGRVEVRLSIDATGKASAHLSADQPQTLDLLQKDAPALTRALREAGLDVSQDGLNFSLRQQGGQDANANNGNNRGTGRGFNLAATTSIDATATSAAYRSVADGRLDIRV